MATTIVSKKPQMKEEAVAEAAANPNVVINDRGNALVKGRTEVDVMGISKADQWTHNYETTETP